MARKAENLSITRDVSGRACGSALKIEGTEASVHATGRPQASAAELIIDTTNILFILGGAFVGLADIIAPIAWARRAWASTPSCPRARSTPRPALARVLPEDLNKYGMIPEFVGRIPVVTSLNELSEEDLVRILTEPKNALVKQYTKMFEFEDSVLTFGAEALPSLTKRWSTARAPAVCAPSASACCRT